MIHRILTKTKTKESHSKSKHVTIKIQANVNHTTITAQYGMFDWHDLLENSCPAYYRIGDSELMNKIKVNEYIQNVAYKEMANNVLLYGM